MRVYWGVKKVWHVLNKGMMPQTERSKWHSHPEWIQKHYKDVHLGMIRPGKLSRHPTLSSTPEFYLNVSYDPEDYFNKYGHITEDNEYAWYAEKYKQGQNVWVLRLAEFKIREYGATRPEEWDR